MFEEMYLLIDTSWSEVGKESVPGSGGSAATSEPPTTLADTANENAALLSALCKHVVIHW